MFCRGRLIFLRCSIKIAPCDSPGNAAHPLFAGHDARPLNEPDMTSQANARAHLAHPDHNTATEGNPGALTMPDIPFGSLEAAAMAELPYTFRPAGTCTRYYNEFFG